MSKLLKASVILLIVTANAHADSPLNTDDAGTTAAGTNQIEQYFYSLLEVGQEADATGAVSSGEDYQGLGNATAFPFSYSRGLTDTMDVTFSPTYYLQPLGNFSRVTNYTLNLKWRFAGNGETGSNLALRPMLIAPASTTQQEYGLGNAQWNYGLTFIASQLSENYELHFNAGYMRAAYNNNFMIGMQPDPKRTNLYSVSIAPVWKVSEKLKLALDVGLGTNPNEPETHPTTYALVALIFSPNKDLDLGLSYQRNSTNMGISFGSEGPYVSRIQAGVTYRFN